MNNMLIIILSLASSNLLVCLIWIDGYYTTKLETETISYTWNNGDKELRTVGVGSSIRHRKHVRFVVFEIRMKLVLEVTPPDRRASGAVARRIARLDHELLYDTVKYVTIIVAIS